MFETGVQPPETADSTRLRLLEAAGEVFARDGFQRATIREICRLAGANVASVNYHFGSKDRLYSEVLRYVDSVATERNPPFPDGWSRRPAQERLAMFIRQFLERAFDDSRPAWHEKLMMREMIEPTRALDDLTERNIRPRSEALQGICRELLGERASKQQVQRAAASIVGQCVFYWHCRPMIAKLMPDLGFQQKSIASIAEHVTVFSVHALKGLSQQSGPSAVRGRRKQA